MLQRNVTEYTETQRIVKKQILRNQHIQIIRKHERQFISTGTIPDEYGGHVPKTKFLKMAVAEIIDKFQTVKLNYENSYNPQPQVEPKLQFLDYLVQGGNDPRWYKSQECMKCKQTTNYHRPHNLLKRRRYRE